MHESVDQSSHVMLCVYFKRSAEVKVEGKPAATRIKQTLLKPRPAAESLTIDQPIIAGFR